jgi:hypothetical protein
MKKDDDWDLDLDFAQPSKHVYASKPAKPVAKKEDAKDTGSDDSWDFDAKKADPKPKPAQQPAPVAAKSSELLEKTHQNAVKKVSTM